MNKIIMLLLVIVAMINFLPVVGVLSAKSVSQAYSIAPPGNDLEILLRHRALLFGVLGGFIFYSVFAPQYQGAAMVMAAISMIGYLLLMWSVGGYNASLYKVAVVDSVGILCLALAVFLKYVVGRN